MHVLDGVGRVGGGLWTVDCGLWTVDCGLWTVAVLDTPLRSRTPPPALAHHPPVCACEAQTPDEFVAFSLALAFPSRLLFLTLRATKHEACLAILRSSPHIPPHFPPATSTPQRAAPHTSHRQHGQIVSRHFPLPPHPLFACSRKVCARRDIEHALPVDLFAMLPSPIWYPVFNALDERSVVNTTEVSADKQLASARGKNTTNKQYWHHE
jgi:hypothetical protein